LRLAYPALPIYPCACCPPPSGSVFIAARSFSVCCTPAVCFVLLILFINSNTRNTKTDIRSRAFVINDTRDNSVLCRYFIREAGRGQVASRRPKCTSHSQKHQDTAARVHRKVCSIHGGLNEVVALCALAQRPILCSAPQAAAVQATGRNGDEHSVDNGKWRACKQ